MIGRCMARHLTQTGVPPGRITVIPNWSDEELMPNNGKPRAFMNGRKIKPVNGARAWPDLFKDTDPKFRILYAGNIGKVHPVDTILQAAEMLYSDHPEIEFIFVGDGPQFDKIAQERAKRRLDNVRLMPWQPPARLRELMESGDIHIISMKNEAAGKLVPCKLYSALAAQRPCIFVGPVHCEAAKVIRDFRAGAIIPQGEGAMLAQTIRRYRVNSHEWFDAQAGAAEAGRIFVPQESISAWMQRAKDVIEVGRLW